jgi:hypothetical protein
LNREDAKSAKFFFTPDSSEIILASAFLCGLCAFAVQNLLASPSTNDLGTDRRPSYVVSFMGGIMLKVGERFVEFELAAHDGSTVRSSELEGAAYLLYFYPKASTPG